MNQARTGVSRPFRQAFHPVAANPASRRSKSCSLAGTTTSTGPSPALHSPNHGLKRSERRRVGARRSDTPTLVFDRNGGRCSYLQSRVSGRACPPLGHLRPPGPARQTAGRGQSHPQPQDRPENSCEPLAAAGRADPPNRLRPARQPGVLTAARLVPPDWLGRRRLERLSHAARLALLGAGREPPRASAVQRGQRAAVPPGQPRTAPEAPLRLPGRVRHHPQGQGLEPNWLLPDAPPGRRVHGPSDDARRWQGRARPTHAERLRSFMLSTT
jgi:hypothetical protein